MIDTMSNVSREKIALVVFVALIAVSLCGLVGYLAIGHSWNVAASNIDDAAGRMDGYTAIVFKGTVTPAEAEKGGAGTAGEADNEGSEVANRAADEVSSGLPKLMYPKKPEENSDTSSKSKGGAESADAGDVGAAATSNGTDTDAAATGEGKAGQGSSANGGVDAGDGGEDADGSDGSGNGTVGKSSSGEAAKRSPSSSASASNAKKKTPIDIEEVEQSYRDKEATVFSIDSENLAKYREGTILKKGNHRFGIFSVAPRMSTGMVEAQVKYFEEYGVDFIVVLTPDKRIVENAVGIDIVISTQDEGLFVMGETINGTFYVNAPQIGSAGIILISPSNVVSAKVVQPS